jgi:hypothetical protein
MRIADWWSGERKEEPAREGSNSLGGTANFVTRPNREFRSTEASSTGTDQLAHGFHVSIRIVMSDLRQLSELVVGKLQV